tara:strand:+ start:841 stop:1065 length:225 start_codon:yes stop_codon:yes gene_type:complete
MTDFTYHRTWEDIEGMLDRAQREQSEHYALMHEGKRKNRIYHMRNYKALEGVVTALRWVLGDVKITKEELLGRD